ncbi:MAG: hypothetical protein FD167_3778 [bacterium]|nr:MAG: hypothetical protein FD167_3778 [bacterium]
MDNQEIYLKQNQKNTKRKTKESNTCYLDLVESGGGMWKASSLPAIKYCLESGVQLRRLAGVSGGGLMSRPRLPCSA